jgi:hydrogenase maturation protease
VTGILVAAMGSEYRRDDGAGLAAARRVAARFASRDAGSTGGSGIEVVSVHDPLELLGRWDAAELAVVLDASRSGAPPGTVRVVALEEVERAGTGGRRSTHGIGVEEVLRLARTLRCAPAKVVLVGIEGEDFGKGEGLSPAVLEGVEAAAERVLGLVEELGRCA